MRYIENDSRARRRMTMLAVTAGTILLTVACGGSPSSAGSSSSASPGSSADAAGGQQVAFAGCMRAHGITDYPDSGNVLGLGASPGSDLDPNNPTYQAARRACQALEPGVHMSQAELAEANADALKVAKCMREHGIANYPDPIPGIDGNSRINLTGVNLNSPQFHAAAQACKKYQYTGPGAKSGPVGNA